ncbi:heme-dependent oxidative N-demethylase subunit alpha family protein [Marinithermofilum abyssi]|uniref:heme-dependent oxidative N-demethylase subunit alpha family protein n=1 Tax=Marinithermofilum abyssi TaxID=1571185 RepID=UPI0016689344
MYLEAGQLCFPGNWSLVFKLGMTFHEIHEPVPRFKEKGVANRFCAQARGFRLRCMGKGNRRSR